MKTAILLALCCATLSFAQTSDPALPATPPTSTLNSNPPTLYKQWYTFGLYYYNKSTAQAAQITAQASQITALNAQVGSMSAQLASAVTLNDIAARVAALNKYAQIVQVVVFAPATKLTLTWQDNSTDELGFKIERSSDGVTFAPLATVAANVTAYVDAGLAPGTYWYRVYAYNAAAVSDYSNITSAKLGS